MPIKMVRVKAITSLAAEHVGLRIGQLCSVIGISNTPAGTTYALAKPNGKVICGTPLFPARDFEDL